MRTLLVAAAATAALLLLPAMASAWTPAECAAWYETHGSNHPDCQDYVPPVQPPPTVPETPPVPPVEQPPAPPVETPPAPPVDTPVDTPEVLAPDEELPTPETPSPVLVKGKEQTPAPKVEVQPVAAPVLPFSGLSVLPIAAVGVALGLAGFAARKALAC